MKNLNKFFMPVMLFCAITSMQAKSTASACMENWVNKNEIRALLTVFDIKEKNGITNNWYKYFSFKSESSIPLAMIVPDGMGRLFYQGLPPIGNLILSKQETCGCYLSPASNNEHLYIQCPRKW